MEAITKEVAKKVKPHFAALNAIAPVGTIVTEREYDRAVNALNQLIDLEMSDVDELIEFIGNRIADYEKDHYQGEDVSAVDMIKFLMEQHNLTQTQLPEIGTQSVVSETLKGKRELNVRQIKALAARFQLPATVFMG